MTVTAVISILDRLPLLPTSGGTSVEIIRFSEILRLVSIKLCVRVLSGCGAAASALSGLLSVSFSLLSVFVETSQSATAMLL